MREEELTPRQAFVGGLGDRLAALELSSSEGAVDLLKEFEKDAWRVYTNPSTMKVIKRVTAVDTTAGGGTCPYNVFDSGHGQNLIQCYGEESQATATRPGYDNPNITPQHFRYKIEMSAHLRWRLRTNPTATQYVGIGIGYPDNLLGGPPWPDPPTAQFVHLRMRSSDLKWVLSSSYGNQDNAAFETVLTGIEQTANSIGQVVRIVWDPSIPRLRGYINGVLGGEITDPSVLPGLDASFGTNVGPNFFQTSGSHANGYITLDIGPIFTRYRDVMGAGA